jgi:hypothetical protein
MLKNSHVKADSHLRPIPTSSGRAITFGSVCVAALQRFLILVFGPFGSNAEKYFFDKFGNDVTTFRPAPQLRSTRTSTLSTQRGYSDYSKGVL